MSEAAAKADFREKLIERLLAGSPDAEPIPEALHRIAHGGELLDKGSPHLSLHDPQALGQEYEAWRQERGLEPTEAFSNLVSLFQEQVETRGFPLIAVPNEEPGG